MENQIPNKIPEKHLLGSRIGIFIDEANIYHSQKTLGWKIDYFKLKQYFEERGQITVLNFYTCFINESNQTNDFINRILKYGYHIVSKKVKIIKKINTFIKKGNLDIELALDAYINKGKYDIFVLFSGDSDFECLLKLLKTENKKVIIFSTAKNISRELIKISDQYHDLKKLRENLIYLEN